MPSKPLFAADTEVPEERSRAEIERLLHQHGADQYSYASDMTRHQASITFRVSIEKSSVGSLPRFRFVCFRVPLPKREDYLQPTSKFAGRRSPEQVTRAWEQARRQRWRALLLVIKAKLEAVANGLASFEYEFMAHVMLPDGSTVGDFMAPQLDRAYSGGGMPDPIGLQLPAHKQ